MKLGLMEIENFLTIKAGKVNLADRGLMLVQGVNEDDTSADSNGAGKSTIGDALCWCLYGTTARGKEGDKVINRYEGKNCRVMVPVTDGDDKWRIARHRKHKTGKNTLQVLQWDDPTVQWIDRTKGTDKLTQELVNQIIGCSYEVFCGAIYAGQNKMPDLPGMTDKNLKLLVEEAAGTEILEKAYEEARKRASGVTREVEEIKRKIEAGDGVLLAMGDNKDALSKSRDAFELNRSASAAAKKQEARDLAAQAKSIRAIIDTLDKAGVEAKITACDAAIAAVGSEQVKERALSKAASDAAAKEASLRSQLAALKKRHDAAKKEVEEVDHKLGCPCTECARPITEEEIKPARDAALARVKSIATDFRDVKTQAEAAIKATQSATDALETFRASMTDTSAKSAERASLLAELNTIQAHERQREKVVQAARDALLKAKEIEDAVNPHVTSIEELEKKIEVRQEERRNLVELNSEKHKELELAEACVKVFSPTGARGEVLDEVTPYLNSQTAKYLGTLSDGNIAATWTTLSKTAKGEVREKFGIDVTHAEGGEDFGSISGGEQRKVQIAAALALQDLVATRASKPIDLFIGDEIDNALDTAGLERLTSILEEKARERGSVFVISHADLKDWVSQVVVVRKKGKQSTIEEIVA